jgi:hypothetical protein
MAGRMSNRDRIENLRAEADAAAKEKAEAKAKKAQEPKAPRKSAGKKAPAAAARVRIVWMVCDAAGRDVKQFPYAQEQEARAEAAQLTTSTGKTHFVKQADVRVP